MTKNKLRLIICREIRKIDMDSHDDRIFIANLTERCIRMGVLDAAKRIADKFQLRPFNVVTCRRYRCAWIESQQTKKMVSFGAASWGYINFDANKMEQGS